MLRQLLIILLSVLVAVPALAQRTVKGQGMVSLCGAYPCGANIAYGQYLSSSMWETGAFLQWRHHTISSDYSMAYIPLGAYANWMYRLYGTRSRVFNLYAGAGAFLGWEIYDPCRALPDFIYDTMKKGSILYGLNAKVQLEVFFTKRVAFIISGNAPFNFSSPCAWVQPACNAGLRINLHPVKV